MLIRIVIVEELPLLRAGIEASLTTMKTVRVVDFGTTPADAIRLSEYRRPDVLLLGINSPEALLSAIMRILAAVQTKVICLTSPGMESSVPELLRAGVRGCLTKAVTSTELVRCIETVLDGGSFVSPSLAAAVLSRPPARHDTVPKRPPGSPLTKRETGILELVARGQSNRDIAHQLLLSEKTVKRYMTLIMHKIHVRNRVQAALFLESPRQPIGGDDAGRNLG